MQFHPNVVVGLVSDAHKPRQVSCLDRRDAVREPLAVTGHSRKGTTDLSAHEQSIRMSQPQIVQNFGVVRGIRVVVRRSTWLVEMNLPRAAHPLDAFIDDTEAGVQVAQPGSCLWIAK